jgi:hypothetical protein
MERSEIAGEIGLHAQKSGAAQISFASEGLAVEQLVAL